MLKIWILDTPLAETLGQLDPSKYEIENFGWDWQEFHTRLLKSVQEGSAPDLIEVGNTWTSRLAQEGVLLNITEFVTNHLDPASKFFPQTLYTCRHAVDIEQYYALPLLVDVRLLFYNKELIGNYLTANPNAFASWKAFEQMCQALKATLPGRVIAWPLDGTGFHDLLPWVWSAGGDFVSLSGEELMDSERTVEAIYRLVHLILTKCAPQPPNHRFDSPDRVRSEFTAGKVGMMAATYWMTHERRWQDDFKAVLLPPDLFPTAFIGGSNLAIVRKHGDENNPAYDMAKAFLLQAVNSDMQITVAKGSGKLPANIVAWARMREQTQDKREQELLAVFNKALCHTAERGMPNLSNAVQVEEAMKKLAETLWHKVGGILRSSIPPTEIEIKCKEMIKDELRRTKRQIEKYLIGYTIQYTSEDVKKIGITPPSHFDLWVEISSQEPIRGNVYVANEELNGAENNKQQIGIGRKSFEILYQLVNAPHRTLPVEKLIEKVENYKLNPDKKLVSEIQNLHKDFSKILKLFEAHLESPSYLADQLNKYIRARPRTNYAIKLKALSEGGQVDAKHFQKALYEIMSNYSEELGGVLDYSAYNKARERVRKNCENLINALGEVKGRPVLQFSKQENKYSLDEHLSICIVVI